MNTNRRTFVKKTGALAAAGWMINLNPLAQGANEKIRLGLMGTRSRGLQVALEMIQQGAEIKTICDVDDEMIQTRGKKIEEAQEKKPESVKDFRKMLDDPEIDAVVIATPDHWHAIPMILACQAEKDVYVEKPLSHTIHEGHLMRNAARKYDRVVQVGTQRRSSNYCQTAVDYVTSGELGDLCLIKAWMCQVRGSIGNPEDSNVPEGVDYDMWLGPAPKRPFNKNRFHYNWRFFWDYCNTELGNQGIHMLDIAMWVITEMLGIDDSLPTHVSNASGIYWLDDAKEVPDTQVTSYEYGDFLLNWELRSFANHQPIQGCTAGVAFYGSEGALLVDFQRQQWKVTHKDGSEGPSEKNTGGSHAKNFLECIKSRKRPNGDIEFGRRTTTLCHLGNIAHKLGRDVTFDPKVETFGEDQEANELLTKSYREPYELPSV